MSWSQRLILVGVGALLVVAVVRCLGPNEREPSVSGPTIRLTNPPLSPPRPPAQAAASAKDASELTCGEWNALPQGDQIRTAQTLLNRVRQGTGLGNASTLVTAEFVVNVREGCEPIADMGLREVAAFIYVYDKERFGA